MWTRCDYLRKGQTGLGLLPKRGFHLLFPPPPPAPAGLLWFRLTAAAVTLIESSGSLVRCRLRIRDIDHLLNDVLLFGGLRLCHRSLLQQHKTEVCPDAAKDDYERGYDSRQHVP